MRNPGSNDESVELAPGEVLYARQGVRREAVALETPRCSAWSAGDLGQAYSPPIWAYDCREPDG
jgi:hypothetical protein